MDLNVHQFLGFVMLDLQNPSNYLINWQVIRTMPTCDMRIPEFL